MYITDYGNHAVRLVDLVSGQISTVLGTLGKVAPPGDGAQVNGPASDALLRNPTGVALDPLAQRLYVAESSNAAILRVDLASGQVYTSVARGGLGRGVPSLPRRFSEKDNKAVPDAGPVSLLFDANNRSLYMVEQYLDVVRRADTKLSPPCSVPATTPAWEQSVSQRSVQQLSAA